MIEPVEDLCARLIRFDTTNRGHGQATGERAAAELVADRLTDAGLKPRLLERAPGRSNVVTRVSGARPELPALLVHAHLDVVPADADEWAVHPFAGEIRDGWVWGRGAVDMKDMVATVLTVAARWAEEGRVPERDVVLAFVADEEDTGFYGAHWLVDDHADLFEGCAAAIGESGGHTVPVRRPDGSLVRLYPVGTAERGVSHLLLTATGRAGHGSRRNDDNAVVKLVDALHRLAAHPWPVRLTPAVRAFIERTAAALGVPVDLATEEGVAATIARFGPAAKLVENTVRNSTRPTVLSAGYKVNVIPSVAQAQVDTRVLPGTQDDLLADVDRLLGPGVRREFISHQPPVQARVDSPWFDAMAVALRTHDPAAVVVPYCMGGGTDAKAFSRLGVECFGFAPLLLPEGFDYRAMAHGVDERVPVDGLRFGVEVLDRFLSG
ncbi:M20/M25/M40 family metallo-hydrolase [Actinokineospora auranticolor]|uniref:Acetylornithine deacetylase/succinyl-diaminopimelate desuccinylase-like protein n=1 Tax=Actinokineospora auranticolor TaxID=155976 RepID=A0A2S6H211_9PSEU|nr:M20/M25/M40 family metallo-hydrolase [Actinokineospora auranticolor]PPK71446.1 acetylornithine deacetylase/succinyl-diaminopimelate desuccinylase-like protein [Actinokineospora auranticolor]